MKKLLIPIVLLILGAGSGIGAGLFLAPPPAETHLAENPCGEMPADSTNHVAEDDSDHSETEIGEHEYARLNNQFVIPVVSEEKVTALVVLSLSIEVPVGGKEDIFAHEPKLRDSFLQVLFDHANSGGFDGAFTSTSNMRVLRHSLRDIAQASLGDRVLDVLIVEIVRQDV